MAQILNMGRPSARLQHEGRRIYADKFPGCSKDAADADRTHSENVESETYQEGHAAQVLDSSRIFAKQKSADEMLPKDVRDVLDEIPFPSELGETWECQERAAPAFRSRFSSPVPAAVREAALRSLWGFLCGFGLPIGSWFKAVALLDRSSDVLGFIGQDEFARSLPATCSALVLMLTKLYTKDRSVGQHLPAFSVTVAQCLQRLGFDAPCGVSRTDVAQRELEIVQALGWRVDPPTVESWIATFSRRLNVILRDTASNSISWLQEQSLKNARVLAVARPSSELGSPKALATGLLGIGMVLAQLLHVDSLRPAHVCAQEWEAMFFRWQPDLAITLAKAAVTAHHSGILVGAFLTATMCTKADFSDACFLVLDHLAKVTSTRQRKDVKMRKNSGMIADLCRQMENCGCTSEEAS